MEPFFCASLIKDRETGIRHKVLGNMTSSACGGGVVVLAEHYNGLDGIFGK
jgi:hypothetical protein